MIATGIRHTRAAQQLSQRRCGQRAVTLSGIAAGDSSLPRYTAWIDWAVPRGYFWTFPRPDGTFSVGVGSTDRRLQRGNLRNLLKQRLAEVSLSFRPVARVRSHFINLAAPLTVYHQGRTAIIGEAAGFVDPLFAEGIYPAIHSGQLAAKCILAAARTNADLSNYTVAIKRALEPELSRARQLVQVIHRTKRVSLWWARRRPQVLDWIGDVLTGERQLSEVTVKELF